MIGRKIRHFTIEEKIGQGGMGVVYRASDSRLRKSVVLKFLSENSAQDETARRRLLREARAAAQLDHPYICHVYEVGEVDGLDYIVMEYVSGQTLKEKLGQGLMPLSECLQIASEIAEALDKAQQKGIVHRDLKPANIMLTPEGHVKVMDFGLAKRVDGEEDALQELTQKQLTGEGAIVGTLPWMSPEQLKGEAIDSRSDIFSFGVILYEMLTGSHPFRKSDVMATASAILQEEPAPVGMLREGLSPLVQYMVRKMLAKDPRKRYQSTREIHTDLAALIQDSGPLDVLRPTAPPRQWSVPVWMAIPALILGALGMWVLQPGTPPAPAEEEFHSVINLPAGKRIAYWLAAGSPVALSPDGRSLAFLAGTMNPTNRRMIENQIFVQQFDESSAHPLPGTEGARSLVFSPDSEWVAFAHPDGTIRRVRVSGPGLETICDSCPTFGAIDWGDNDRIVFSGQINSGRLFSVLVPANGEEPQEIYSIPSQETELTIWQGILTPSWLPGDKGLLFGQVRGNWNLAFGEVQTFLKTPGLEPRMLIDDAVDARYVDPGYIVFARAGNLWAIRFDLETLQAEGSPTLAMEGVNQFWRSSPSVETGDTHSALSSNGTLAFIEGGIWPAKDLRREYVWVSRSGEEELLNLGKYEYPQILPSGQIILLDDYDTKLWIWDDERQSMEDLHVDGVAGFALGPGPDEITYSRWGLDTTIYTRKVFADPETERELIDPGCFTWPLEWTEDGDKLIYQATPMWDIWMLDDGATRPIIENAFRADLSPNGEWIAYTSQGDPRQVHIRPFPGPGPPRQISTEGGQDPIWTSDNEIIYRNGNDFFRVSLEASPQGFDLTSPQPLFSGPYSSPDPVRSSDVHPDGRLLLMKRPVEDEAHRLERWNRIYPSEIRIIQNWVQTLEKRLPQVPN